LIFSGMLFVLCALLIKLSMLFGKKSIKKFIYHSISIPAR